MFPNKRDPIKSHTAFPILFRDWEPDPEAEYRKLGLRIFTRSEQVSQALFDRVRRHIPATWSTPSPKGDTIEHWRLRGLHERIRFVCYGKGQRFPPHRDDPWVQSDAVRSFLTFVIYLSHSGTDRGADFEGGEFAFVEPLPKSTLVRDRVVVSPEPGLVVVFPHRELHESKALQRGLKFMIRSDLMFEFDHSEPLKQAPDEAKSEATAAK